MPEQKIKKKAGPTAPDGEICRDLICPEEWRDPEGRKVLTEFHKEGLPKELVGVEADLANFEKYWKKKGSTDNVTGEYHKNGAPFLDRDQGLEAAQKLDDSAPINADVLPPHEQKTAESVKEQATKKTIPVSGASRPSVSEGATPKGNIQRPIDLGLIEMVSYALFRVAFRNGLSIPIKRDGMVDMDFTVKGKEITINTNQLYFTVPELNVWHIVYQHKGKPILEMGRGVKNGLKIHRMQAIRLGLEMWNGSRKMNKLKLKQLKEADKQAHSRSSNE